MGSNHSWFWTAERLSELRELLRTIAERDEKGFYIGPIGLSSYIAENRPKLGFELPDSQVPNGLAILVFLGVLEAKRSGRIGLGYKRRFNPDALVTGARIAEYRSWKRMRERARIGKV